MRRTVFIEKVHPVALLLMLSLFPVDELAALDVCKTGSSNADTAEFSLQAKRLCLVLGGGATLEKPVDLSVNKSTGFPIVYASYGNAYWDNNKIGHYLYESISGSANTTVAAHILVPDAQIPAVDENNDELSPALEGGVRVVSESVLGKVILELNVDLESEHDGMAVVGQYVFPLTYFAHTINPYVSWNHRDAENTRYYFATSNPSASSNTFAVGYSYFYKLNRRLTAYHSARVQHFDKGFDSGRLSINSETYSTDFGLLYRFK